jgi:glutamine amidotransferase
MDIAIIKYNAGNIRSVVFALERLGINAIVTDDAGQIQSANKVIFPGVGEASSAMKYLKERKLDRVITELKQPVLGICLGMQLLCEYSEENNTSCLNIFSGCRVRLFPSAGKDLKVPHVGWNTISALQSPLFKNINENSYCYFVHSYYAETNLFSIAKTDYGIVYSSAMQKDNFYGVQFHPEKSAETGEIVLKNFLNL